MATLSSHVLDGTDGSHAGHIRMQRFIIAADGSRTPVFDASTDAGGRLAETVAESSVNTDAVYELVIKTRDYWAQKLPAGSATPVSPEVVFRLEMPDAAARYHIPFIISPHQYSVWFSSPEPIQ